MSQRLFLLLTVILAMGVLSGFSHADNGSDQVNSVKPMLSSDDRKNDIERLRGMVETAAENGAITNAATTRSLLVHLTAVEYYVDQGNNDKALEQLRRFDTLVAQHQNIGTIERSMAIFMRKSTVLISNLWSQTDDGKSISELSGEK